MAKRKKAALDRGTIRILIELAVLLITIIVLLVLIGNVNSGPRISNDDPIETTDNTLPSVETIPVDTSPEGIFQAFLREHNLTKDDYTETMIENYALYPECREFILNYPLEKDKEHTADISWADRSNGVPLFLQFDERWGYTKYGFSVGGISGCAPTCLSMVAYYLTGDTKYTPEYMMNFSTEDGHVGQNGGTQWTLFSKGAKNLGFKVEELPLLENTLIKRLEQGIPVVLSVGPGDFTQNGHYIVCVGYKDGKIKVNDPFSKANSEKEYTYAQLEPQIRNLWAISNP